MGDGIYAALSGAVAQSVALETTANNLANLSTTGYMKQREIFREVLAKNMGPNPQSLHFSAVSATVVDRTSGARKVTGRPLDIALEGGQFLAVETPRGERYTRAGSLQVGGEGMLQAPGGFNVLGEGGPIEIRPDAKKIEISPTGAVVVDDEEVGKLKVVSFEDNVALIHDGGTLVRTANGESGDTSEKPIGVGALEESNVSAVASMNELMMASRMFDAFQKAIETFRDADRRVATTVPNGR